MKSTLKANSLVRISQLYLGFSLLLFLIRIFERIGMEWMHHPEYELNEPFSRGFFIDLAYLSILFIVFFILQWITKKSNIITKMFWWLCSIIIFLIIIGEVYFIATSTAMDHAVFIHSWLEVKITLSNSLNYPILMISLSIIIPWLIFYLVYRFFGKKIFLNKAYKYVVIFALLSSISAIFIQAKPGQFKRENQYLMAQNKLQYLIASSLEFWAYNTNYSENLFDRSDWNEFRKDVGNFDFIGDEYPLLHHPEKSNVLGPYFPQNQKAPSIVVIVCESLSADFVDQDSYFGTFTPFLDSLAQQSLYWPNTLSATERTFGALPAVLGSLPLSRKGFAFMAGHYPKHLTLISLLKKNNYFTSYFHGGPLGFDLLYDFIKKQHTDFIFREYEKESIPNDAENKEVSWGLYDHEVFSAVINELKNDPKRKTRLDVILTLTTHAPFNIPNRSHWERKFNKQLKQLNADQRKRAINEKYRLSAFMYLDSSIKNFIHNYLKTRSDSNTIFVITGDHRMGTPANNNLQKYHVPLIVYSPKLKKHQRFNAAGSHNAISPTIVSLLKDNYALEFPDSVSWFTGSLDTIREFRNRFHYPFMRNSRIIEEYIDGNRYLFRDELYEVLPHFELRKVDEPERKQSIQNKLSRYNKYNYYMCYFDKLYPNDIFANTNKQWKTIVHNHWPNDYAIDNGSEYISIIPKHTFENNQSEYRLEIDFDVISTKNRADSLAMVVINLNSKDGEQKIWEGIHMEGLGGDIPPAGKLMHMNIRREISLKRYGIGNGSYLKVYFWNNKKTSCVIKNMKINFSIH